MLPTSPPEGSGPLNSLPGAGGKRFRRSGGLPPQAMSGCRRLAAEQGTAFADAGQWGVSLLFDGVHFSPEGHRAFADGIRRALELPAADRA